MAEAPCWHDYQLAHSVLRSPRIRPDYRQKLRTAIHYGVMALGFEAARAAMESAEAGATGQVTPATAAWRRTVFSVAWPLRHPGRRTYSAKG